MSIFFFTVFQKNIFKLQKDLVSISVRDAKSLFSKGNSGTWPNTSFLVQITLVFIQFGPKHDQIQTAFFWIFNFFSSSKLKLGYLRITMKKYFYNLVSISSYLKNIPNGCSNVDQKLTKLVQKWTLVVRIEFNVVQNCGNLPMFRFRWFEWLVAGKLTNNNTLTYFSHGMINMVK